jgi:hypothetical protein
MRNDNWSDEWGNEEWDGEDGSQWDNWNMDN